MIKYVSLFSGIEAAKVAFDTANIPAQPLAFFEIEKQQSKLLAEKYTEVPNYGDVCKFDFSIFKGKANFVCGGSPCQSFSLANQRTRDHSGVNLMFEFCRAIWEIEPEYFLYENVPQAKAAFDEFVNERLFTDKTGLSRKGICPYFLAEKYNIFQDVINSADFGFMQPRKRYYCIGIKRESKYTPTPYIHVRPLFKNGEYIEFEYLPPTNYDLRQFEKYKKIYGDYLNYTYSGQEWSRFAHSKNVSVLVKQHPILEVSPEKKRIGKAKYNCAILSAETHEKLQGFPAGYTSGFSFTRRIAMIGNSWHVGTVAEIFKQIFIF